MGQDMTVGFRIKRTWTRVSAETATRFRAIPVANVSDCMARMTAGGPGLRPMHASGVLAGPAFTVKSRPGDNLMLHKAIDLAAPGDVIVCDAGGDLTNSLMGEMMLAHAIKRGIGGFVLNGSIRDRDAFPSGTSRFSRSASRIAVPTRTAPAKSASASASPA